MSHRVDGHPNAAAVAPSSSSAGPASTAVAFPEESAIVMDKWLMDVCGEEDLQFPSHRRAQYPAYIARLRRVANTKQFMANTFDYPARSGTREVLVLQKTLEALGGEEESLRQEISWVQENLTQLRRVLDERTMGASSIVEEEKAQAAKLAEMKAEEKKAAAAAAMAKQSSAPPPPMNASTQAQMAARQQGYAPLSASTPAVLIAPSRPANATTTTTSASTVAASRVAGTPLPMHDADDGASVGSSAVSSRSAAESNTFSAVARAARRADYEKKKALSLRYMAEVQSKTQATAAQRKEVEERHAGLLREKDQLDKEYAALQTTEALVVARHEEAEAHAHEETAQLTAEAAAYAGAEAAFASVWDEMEMEATTAEAPTATTAATPAAEGEEERSSDPPPLPETAVPGQGDEEEQAFLAVSPSDGGAAADAAATATASASLAPAEHDESPPEVTLHTHGPPSHGSQSVVSSSASSAPPTPRSPPPVERVLLTDGDNAEAAEEEDTHVETTVQETRASASQPAQGSSSTTAAAAAMPTARADNEARRVYLEELRHRLSELGAAAQACRRQLLNTSQTHMGRFRQSQQRLRDWQDMAAQARTTEEQLRGQVEVITTVLQDGAARLDMGSAESTYAAQLARLNQLLKERLYETFQYYVGGGEEAAVAMMYDANAEEELRGLHRPSPSAAAGGMTPLRGVGGASSSSAVSSVTPTRESSVSSAYHTPGGTHMTGASTSAVPPTSMNSGFDSPHKHRSRYELVRHLQRWEAALLADRLAILKAASMVPGPFSGAGANTRKTRGFTAARCYQELRHLLLQPKPANGSKA
ncbi:hypothetical protein ABB37_08082 [Leptomonas pyrrhocoris]|uniref:Uncharacterized protein n=1 Tax=Leptomonas pyrrhocoris TaxID=157538 RepID=A0A0N0DSC8_LEPPY|nr:hypothetical protein ABB37_08082 [Leptomonas pyrrhocoris]KPA75912.1 hypothetical protein ABB37_08082 [Leptomonas pyrrhocoris]|eukprot:XP_015654351.1 hypothetical protein ABB37_08082 [Leptomonas pyrrhocoris]